MAENDDWQAKCLLENNRVSMCSALSQTINGNAMSAKSGNVVWSFINTDTGAPTRTAVGCKSGQHKKSGLLFNFCPFCGEKIKPQFADAKEAS